MAKPTVAIIGSVAQRNKFANKSLRAHLQAGFDAYPVNPAGGQAEGLTVYRSVNDIPLPTLDRVSLYVRPEVGITLLDEIAMKGCKELWFNPGTESREVVDRARSLGLNPVLGCSIIDVGFSPREFGD